MTELKYSICLDAVCRGKDRIKALEEVKAAGFGAYEFWRWDENELPAMKEKADALGLTCVSFGGRRNPGSLADPTTHDEWLEGLKISVGKSKMMGNKRMSAGVGADTGARRDFQHSVIVKGLKRAAALAEENDMIFLIEPLNTRINHPGVYLEYSDDGFAILDEVGSSRMRMMFDIYHQQITEGDIINRMVKRIKQIGHVHCAGSDGRHELDIGELNHHYIFKALAEADYDGYIGLEYFPEGDSLASLKRMYEYLHK